MCRAGGGPSPVSREHSHSWGWRQGKRREATVLGREKGSVYTVMETKLACLQEEPAGGALWHGEHQRDRGGKDAGFSNKTFLGDLWQSSFLKGSVAETESRGTMEKKEGGVPPEDPSFWQVTEGKKQDCCRDSGASVFFSTGFRFSS